MEKILLINLPIQTNVMRDITSDMIYNPPLGILALGSWIELNGYTSIVVDLNYNRISAKELLENIGKDKPILIGISSYTENIEMAVSTARLIKKEYPYIKIVLGGPHPTLVPEDAINNDYVDFVIRREGEATLLELLEAIRTKEKSICFDNIPGLVFKRDGKIIKNVFRGQIHDLDVLPIPKRELVGMETYRDTVNISTSRGCPGKCIYCSARILSGAPYRTRTMENVFLEIVLLKATMKERINRVYFIDETFTALTERVLEFIKIIKIYALDINWICASRIDIMTEELIDHMASSRCEAVHFGIESGNQEVLDKIQKGIDLVYAERIISYMYKKKVIPLLSFMLGHYCDTVETMNDTLSFIKRMYSEYKADISVYFNTPFPGTWQHTNKDKLGMTIKAKSYKNYSLIEPIVETENFNINDQRKVYYESTKYFERYARLNRERERMCLIND